MVAELIVACPEELGKTIFLVSMIVISFSLTFIALLMLRNSIIALFGSFLIIFTGFAMKSCDEFVGNIVLGIGLVLLIISALQPMENK